MTTPFNDLSQCLAAVERFAVSGLEKANKTYYSTLYEEAIQAMRQSAEAICKATFFHHGQQSLIANNSFSNLINMIKARGWFSSVAADNEKIYNCFETVRLKGNLGSHPSPTPAHYNEMEEARVDFRKILRWFYNEVSQPIPADVQNAIDGRPLESEERTRRQDLHRYFERNYKMYEGVVMNDEQGLTLKDLYIDPNFGVWEGAKQKAIHYANDSRFITKEGFLHDFATQVIKDKQELYDTWICKNPRLFVLLGYPGQGKTSFCKHLMHRWINSAEFWNNNVLFLRLRDIESVQDLFNNPFEIIRKEMNRYANNKISQELFDRSILILDGLDEIAMRDNSSKSEIDSFCKELLRLVGMDKYANMRIILTSRYGYIDLDKFSEERHLLVAQIEQLSLSQQINWLNRYKSKHSECLLDAEKLEKIHQDRSLSHIAELINQPILLHLVALLNLKVDDKATRATIYDQLFTTLINRAWENNTQIQILKNIKKDDLRKFLREIAFAMYKSGCDYIRRYDLTQLSTTKPFLEKVKASTEDKYLKDILKYLMVAFYMQEVQDPENGEEINKENSKYAIEFLHKSLQEYLVAEKIWNEMLKFIAQNSLTEEFQIETASDALRLLWNTISFKPFNKYICDILYDMSIVSVNNIVLLERMKLFRIDLLSIHFMDVSILPNHCSLNHIFTVFNNYFVFMNIISNKKENIHSIDKDYCSLFLKMHNAATAFVNYFFNAVKDVPRFSRNQIFINNTSIDNSDLSFLVDFDIRARYSNFYNVSIKKMWQNLFYGQFVFSDCIFNNCQIDELHLSIIIKNNLFKNCKIRALYLKSSININIVFENSLIDKCFLIGSFSFIHCDISQISIDLDILKEAENLYQTKLPQGYEEQLLAEGYAHLFEKPEDYDELIEKPN